jgi:hypothetical protein
MPWYCPSVHSQALPLLPLPQLCVAKQIADDVCGKHSAFGVIAGQEFHRAEPVIFVLPRRFNFVLPVHTFSLVESPFSRIRGRDSRYEQLSQCLDAALISAALHYGLRYGCAPATGNFQRLRGRPPVAQSSELRSLPGQLSCRASFGDVRGDKQGLATRAALPTQPPQDLQRNLAVLCGVLTPRSPCTERARTG